MPTFAIWVNSRIGSGFYLRQPPALRRSNVATFETYDAALAELTARGYVNSTSVDRDANGQRIAPMATTAYVVETERRFL